MENTCGDTSWINGNNERHNIIIHRMIIADLLDSNQYQINGAVHQIHHHKSIEKNSQCIRQYLTSLFMVWSKA